MAQLTTTPALMASMPVHRYLRQLDVGQLANAANGPQGKDGS
jgi:hypothetical protein